MCFCVRSLVFLENDFLEPYDKLLRNLLCKVTNVKMDDYQFLQAVLPAAKGGLGVSSARLLALPTFLASAVGAKDALSEIFGLEHVDGTYDDALKLLLLLILLLLLLLLLLLKEFIPFIKASNKRNGMIMYTRHHERQFMQWQQSSIEQELFKLIISILFFR